MSREAARRMLDLARACKRKKKTFSVALSGGSTPIGLFDSLAANKIRKKFPWNNTHFFWTDERWVSPSSDRSNFKLFFERVGKRVPLKKANMHPMFKPRMNEKQGARLYEKELRNHFKLGKNRFPAFDLIVLGVGEDGHIASLLPKRKELREKNKLAVSVPKFGVAPVTRVSLTLPVINAAHHVLFLLSGKRKAPVARRLLKGSSKKIGGLFPASCVRTRHEKVTWYLDEEAASKLND